MHLRSTANWLRFPPVRFGDDGLEKRMAMRAAARLVGFAALLAAPLACGEGAAAAEGSYMFVPAVDIASCSDIDENMMTLKARYYFFGVNDDENPYRLQPFLQKATWVEAGLQDGPGDTSLFGVEGQYVFPDTMIGARAGLKFGDYSGLDNFQFKVGGIFYIGSERFAAELSLLLWDLDGEGCTVLDIGGRYVMPLEATGGTLEIYGGFRSTDPETGESDSGLVAEVRYFFTKEVFAGVSFATDDSDLFSVSGGYAHASGFQAEIEVGSDDSRYGGDFFRAEVGWRF